MVDNYQFSIIFVFLNCLDLVKTGFKPVFTVAPAWLMVAVETGLKPVSTVAVILTPELSDYEAHLNSYSPRLWAFVHFAE